MLYHKKELFAILALTGLSFIVHFAWFGHPNTTVFDEVHFGKFLSAYFTHEYYFDIHPPLGKLIEAGWGWLWGFKPGFSFANIGDVFPDHMYMALRFLPSLAGAILPLVIFGIGRRLGLSRKASLLAGTLVALDNALVAQSRFILLDSFLLLFGFSAVWCYLKFKSQINNHKLQAVWLLAAGTLGAMSVSIKWTGATFLALIVILEAIRLWRNRKNNFGPEIVRALLALMVIPFLIYYLIFMVHFALLTKSGTGDAFMSQEFQHTLKGNEYQSDSSLKAPSSFGKFVELNVQMYESNQRLTASHPYSSPWYTWPLMQRPIFYWVEGASRIYLIGNPIVWWGSTVAVMLILSNILLSGLRRIDRTAILLIGIWFMNLLPFIGIHRVMFLYHYFIALIWAILMLAYVVDHTKNVKRVSIAIGIAALVAFAFFSPLTYGLPMSEQAYNARAWFPSWR